MHVSATEPAGAPADPPAPSSLPAKPVNPYRELHRPFLDYGVADLGLGDWRECPTFYGPELPAVPAVYFFLDLYGTADEVDEMLYIGIAPGSLQDRWGEPEAPGRGGHHVMWRFLRPDHPLECSEAVWTETAVAYCELPGRELRELERIEECLIDLLAPALNRQKSPLHAYKTAVKHVRQYAAKRGWSPYPHEWPNTKIEAFHESVLDQAQAFRASQIERAPKMMGAVAGHWSYRALVPGFDFLPYQWQRSMRDCPTDVIRNSVLKTLAKLDCA